MITMTEEISGKEIKEFILNNIQVKEIIVRPWKLNFKPNSRVVVVENRAFISTKWVNYDYCEGFIVECLQCEGDIKRPPEYERDLLWFIIQHSEEHIKKGIKNKNKTLDDFI